MKRAPIKIKKEREIEIIPISSTILVVHIKACKKENWNVTQNFRLSKTPRNYRRFALGSTKRLELELISVLF